MECGDFIFDSSADQEDYARREWPKKIRNLSIKCNYWQYYKVGSIVIA